MDKEKIFKAAKYCSDNNAGNCYKGCPLYGVGDCAELFANYILDKTEDSSNWEKFLNGNIAVNLSTIEEYSKFLKECENKNPNLTWRSGDRLTDLNLWEKFKTRFCVRVNYKKVLSFASKSWYNEQGYNIISYKDFEHEEENI